MAGLARQEARSAFRKLVFDLVPDPSIKTRVWQMLESIVFGAEPILRGVEHFEVRYGSGTPTSSDYPEDGYGIWIDEGSDAAYVILQWRGSFFVIGGSGSGSLPAHTHVESEITDLDHLTEADISHLNINGIGTNTHPQLDTHVADGTIHFTVGSLNLSAYLKKDGTVGLTADWDAGSHKITAQELSADIISEETPAAGVTVDGVLIKDSEVDDSYFAGNDWEDLTDGGATALHTHNIGEATAAPDFCLYNYVDVKERQTEWNLHGGLSSLATAQPLDSTPTDLPVTAGIGKLLIVINAGSDFAGEITVTGTSVDRNTGAETALDTETITVDALTTDGSDTDAAGNTRHSFTGAYITSKWFKGSVTLSTSDLTLTDVDIYQVTFEQLNDSPGAEITTLDVRAVATNSSAWMYGYLYSLEVTGDKCDITREVSIELPAADVSANKFYSLRRSALGLSIDGTTDGFWMDFFPGPMNQNYWEDVNIKLWGTITTAVVPGEDLGALPATINWEDDTIGNPPSETPMYSGENSTVRAIVQISGAPAGLTKMVEIPTVSGNHVHNWRSLDKFDISAGIRVEVIGYFPSPGTNEDFYVGLAGDANANSSIVGLPDHSLMALFREDDNDFYQRYSTQGVGDWPTENQIDFSQNMNPQTWGHFQFEYKPGDDDVVAQYRIIWSGSAGGFKTLTMASAWSKPNEAYVFWGGLNNSTSFVRVANVWIGALTDSWPYVGTP